MARICILALAHATSIIVAVDVSACGNESDDGAEGGAKAVQPIEVGVTTRVTDATRQASTVKEGTTAHNAAKPGLEHTLWINNKLSGNNEVAVGEKATIPLYGLSTNDPPAPVNFTSLFLRWRTPCAFGNALSPREAEQRPELNGFDKGENGIRCMAGNDEGNQHDYDIVLLAGSLTPKTVRAI